MAAPSSPPPLHDVAAALLSPEKDITPRASGWRGKRVMVRADLNVPLGPDGRVADAERIDAALPTLRLLAHAGARVLVVSHLGRPEPGKEPEADMRRRDSLEPVATVLRDALGNDTFVGLAEDLVGPSARALAERLADGQVR